MLLLGTIGILASWILFVLQDLVIKILYGDTHANGMIAYFLVGFLIALPLQMMIGYFTISLYSAKDTRSVLRANIISTIAAVATCYATQPLGNISLIYGVIVMALVNFIAISFLYRRKRLI